MVTFGEVLKFDPEQLDEVFRVCSSAQATCTDLTTPLKSLETLHTWSGAAADAAKTSAGKTRVDIDAHGQEIAQVATAVKNCHAEGEAVKKAAVDTQNTADAEHLHIDPDSGKVTDPSPPNTSGWTADQIEAYTNKVQDLQRKVDAVTTDATRFDEDLAALINGADGQLPLTPPNSTAGDNEIDRRGNEIAAFRTVYHHDPASENDWRMAEALDTHTYDPKYRGAKANVTLASFNPEPGAGVYRQNMYIPVSQVQNLSLDSRVDPHDVGDNRGPSATAPADASRVSVYADMDNGILVARQNPSVSTDGHDLAAGVPQVSAIQAKDGSLAVNYSAADPFAPGPAKSIARVAGQMTISPGTDGNLQTAGTVTSYPSNEAYQYKPDGTTNQLFSMQATTSQAGPMTNLPFGPDTHVGTGPMAQVTPTDPHSDPMPLPSSLGHSSPPTILHNADLTPLSSDSSTMPHIGMWTGGSSLPGTAPTPAPTAAQPGTEPAPPPAPSH